MNVDIVYIIVLYIMTLHALCNIVHLSYDIPVTTYITKQSLKHLEPSKDCNSSSKPSHVLPELQWSGLHQLSNITNFLLRISKGNAFSKNDIFSKLAIFHQNLLFEDPKYDYPTKLQYKLESQKFKVRKNGIYVMCTKCKS